MQIPYLNRSSLFGAGVLVGIFLTVLFNSLMPRWEVKLLHYQHGSKSHHQLVRVNAYSGEVEELATSVPK